MRNLAITLAVLSLSALHGHGKAYFFTRNELILKADVIAIIDVAEPEIPEAHDPDPFADPFADPGDGRQGKNWNYRQCAKAKVVELIKGKVEGDLMIYGGETFICAQCNLQKGRFLAFLTKDGDLWVGANWQGSLRPVSDGKIEWYASAEERWPETMMAQDAVLAEVRKVLAEVETVKDVDKEKTISLRLRAAADTERAIATTLSGAIPSLLGLKAEEIKPEDQQLIRSLAEKHEGVTMELASIELNIGMELERDGGANYKEVQKAMMDAKVAVGLEEIGKKISKNQFYSACEDAMFWAKHMGEWADLLDGKTAGDFKEGKSLDAAE